jgi:hypothetical protein
MAIISQDLSQSIFGVINSLSDSLDISINDKKTSGTYIEVSCGKDRNDTRISLEQSLSKVPGIKVSRLNIASRSSFDLTKVDGFGSEMRIVYKNSKGGMQETTLNSSITELFPALAFSLGVSPKLKNDKFYNEILIKNQAKLGAYKNEKAYEAGKQVLNDATNSTKFDVKTTNAKAIYQYLLSENSRKKISRVVWGYRNNMKPDGVNANHKGDIFVVFNDKKMLGISIKAGGAGTKEPQFNSYVRPIFSSFGMLSEYSKLQKASYETYYKNIPNMVKFSNYGKTSMTDVVIKYEKEFPKQYENLYNLQLAFIRQTICNLMNNNQEKAKQWLLREVVAEQKDVPLVVLKAEGSKAKLIDDDSVLRSCVQTSKKKGGIFAYPSKRSKQNWHIDMICDAKKTTLNFSIRTNKSGTGHKLAQYVNLAVKFNGLEQ